MLVDTKGLIKELEGKTLRVCFKDGEIAIMKLETILTFDCHESCNGFIYKVVSTNRPEKFEEMRRQNPGGFSCWGKFEDVVSWDEVKEERKA